ncbi:hypothetical protein [Pseudomonas gingeri]|uniref:hypothetical protein n=1 Tax=Pseudomonas gingeri TaxID=117681 RepID=UPI0015A3D2A4|nr:hypothetical protein [Pseudomonas gingeri]NWD09784.1 hypothetical protein [Pseudomonas gingeri]NWE36524.1 hypothetical protein [Pseudomonas gingeri]NWE60907.1 hypothetical protein [Pseudomonas gingeri]NWF01292.1 hypothetical protein [Pseudomonas gingeri]
MSCFKPHGVGVGLTLSACVAVGEPLPESSLLSRYGVTPEQLPVMTQVETSGVSEDTSSRLFQLKPEAPLVDVRIGERAPPEEVGNITIDNMARRDYERCLRLQGQLLERESRRPNPRCE